MKVNVINYNKNDTLLIRVSSCASREVRSKIAERFKEGFNGDLKILLIPDDTVGCGSIDITLFKRE